MRHFFSGVEEEKRCRCCRCRRKRRSEGSEGMNREYGAGGGRLPPSESPKKAMAKGNKPIPSPRSIAKRASQEAVEPLKKHIGEVEEEINLFGTSRQRKEEKAEEEMRDESKAAEMGETLEASESENDDENGRKRKDKKGPLPNASKKGKKAEKEKKGKEDEEEKGGEKGRNEEENIEGEAEDRLETEVKPYDHEAAAKDAEEEEDVAAESADDTRRKQQHQRRIPRCAKFVPTPPSISRCCAPKNIRDVLLFPVVDGGGENDADYVALDKEEEEKEKKALRRKDSIAVTHEHEMLGKGPHHNAEDEVRELRLPEAKAEERRKRLDSVFILHEHEKMGKGPHHNPEGTPAAIKLKEEIAEMRHRRDATGIKEEPGNGQLEKRNPNADEIGKKKTKEKHGGVSLGPRGAGAIKSSRLEPRPSRRFSRASRVNDLGSVRSSLTQSIVKNDFLKRTLWKGREERHSDEEAKLKSRFDDLEGEEPVGGGKIGDDGGSRAAWTKPKVLQRPVKYGDTAKGRRGGRGGGERLQNKSANAAVLAAGRARLYVSDNQVIASAASPSQDGGSPRGGISPPNDEGIEEISERRQTALAASSFQADNSDQRKISPPIKEKVGITRRRQTSLTVLSFQSDSSNQQKLSPPITETEGATQRRQTTLTLSFQADSSDKWKISPPIKESALTASFQADSSDQRKISPPIKETEDVIRRCQTDKGEIAMKNPESSIDYCDGEECNCVCTAADCCSCGSQDNNELEDRHANCFIPKFVKLQEDIKLGQLPSWWNERKAEIRPANQIPKNRDRDASVGQPVKLGVLPAWWDKRRMKLLEVTSSEISSAPKIEAKGLPPLGLLPPWWDEVKERREWQEKKREEAESRQREEEELKRQKERREREKQNRDRDDTVDQKKLDEVRRRFEKQGRFPGVKPGKPVSPQKDAPTRENAAKTTNDAGKRKKNAKGTIGRSDAVVGGTAAGTSVGPAVLGENVGVEEYYSEDKYAPVDDEDVPVDDEDVPVDNEDAPVDDDDAAKEKTSERRLEESPPVLGRGLTSLAQSPIKQKSSAQPPIAKRKAPMDFHPNEVSREINQKAMNGADAAAPFSQPASSLHSPSIHDDVATGLNDVSSESRDTSRSRTDGPEKTRPSGCTIATTEGGGDDFCSLEIGDDDGGGDADGVQSENDWFS